MNANIGIPTLYRGVKFRSRLEATWAAFFDLESWPWEFEPIDLAGYIPDFVLRFHRPLLVEVKGVSGLSELDGFTAKIEHSGWEHEALIVPSGPVGSGAGDPYLGLLGSRDGDEWFWSPARSFVCLSCGNLSVLSEDAGWDCRVCGVDGGNAHVGHSGGTVDGVFAAAKNRVQWRAAL